MQQDELRSEIRINWFHLENVIIDEWLPKMGLSAFAVYSVLRRFAGGNKDTAFPSFKTLAGKVGCSRQTAIVAIKKLEELGLIKIEKAQNSNNIYTLKDVGVVKKLDHLVQNLDQGSLKIRPEEELLRITNKEYIYTTPTPSKGIGMEEKPYLAKSESGNPLPPAGRPPLPLEVPPDLAADKEAIAEWLAYKAELGKKYKPRGLTALWGLLRAIPAAKRSSSIRMSMGQGWQGIHEDRRIVEETPAYWRPLTGRP